jgi:uncharacterized protein (DUF924 family)
VIFNRVIDFWFEEVKPKQWFKKDPVFDQLIRDRFGIIHMKAVQLGLERWRDGAIGRLAEIIVLDQFSRNIHRHKKAAFTADIQALMLAQQAVEMGFDTQLTARQRSFLYMPYMHSEDRHIQAVSVYLYRRNGIQHNLDSALKHKLIIDRFGRYPHRNSILGRTSTEQEILFLDLPGSEF